MKMQSWRGSIDGHSYEINTPLIETTSMFPGTDPNWVGLCSAGHEVTNATLVEAVDFVRHCPGDCGAGEPHDVVLSHTECPECGDAVERGMHGSSYRSYIPGEPSFLRDGVSITKEEFEADMAETMAKDAR